MPGIRLSDKITDKYNPHSNIFSLNPPPPNRHIQIEISNLCNYRCIFCPRTKTGRKVGMIDDNLCRRLLSEVYDFGGREMSFHYSGDPFLHPKLSEYISLAKKIGYQYVYIDTNGFFATPEKLRAAIDAGVDSIKFSVNAGHKETYIFTHGVDGLDRVIANIRYCDKYRRKINPSLRLFVSCVYTKYTEDDRGIIKQLFDFCDEVIFLPAADFSGVMPEVNTLLKPSSSDIDNNYANRCPCPMVFGGIYITYEGLLSACCTNFDNHVIVADLNKVSLTEAWYGDKMTELRRKHIEGDLIGLVCHNCVTHECKPFKAFCTDFAIPKSWNAYYADNSVQKRIADFYTATQRRC